MYENNLQEPEVIRYLNSEYQPKFNLHSTLHWNHFNEDRKQLLNLITWDEFKATY